MKIIKEGKDPKKEKFIGTCRYCNQVQEAEKEELTVRSDYRNGTLYSETCLLCGSIIWFNKKRIFDR